MKTNNITKGDLGEKLAVDYLSKNNYEILETKYRTPVGEIDIISKQKGYIVFVEVKYRKSTEHGLPREAVNKPKQSRIRKAALYYVVSKYNSDIDMRFDVIEILDNNIYHLENAF